MADRLADRENPLRKRIAPRLHLPTVRQIHTANEGDHSDSGGPRDERRDESRRAAEAVKVEKARSHLTLARAARDYQERVIDPLGR